MVQSPKPPLENKYHDNLLKAMILMSQVTIILNLVAYFVFQFVSQDSLFENKVWRILAPIGAGVISLTLILGLIYNGVRALGLDAGHTGFGSQVWHVTKKLTLYMLLPSFVFTALLFLLVFLVKN